LPLEIQFDISKATKTLWS